MKCMRCKIYTLKEKCPKCEGDTAYAIPPKFSIEDRYGKYRRMMKRQVRDNE